MKNAFSIWNLRNFGMSFINCNNCRIAIQPVVDPYNLVTLKRSNGPGQMAIQLFSPNGPTVNQPLVRFKSHPANRVSILMKVLFIIMHQFEYTPPFITWQCANS